MIGSGAPEVAERKLPWKREKKKKKKGNKNENEKREEET